MWEVAVYLAVAADVFGGVLFCAILFSRGMSRMGSGTELGRFLGLFLCTLAILRKFNTENSEHKTGGRKVVQGRSGLLYQPAKYC